MKIRVKCSRSHVNSVSKLSATRSIWTTLRSAAPRPDSAQVAPGMSRISTRRTICLESARSFKRKTREKPPENKKESKKKRNARDKLSLNGSRSREKRSSSRPRRWKRRGECEQRWRRSSLLPTHSGLTSRQHRHECPLNSAHKFLSQNLL